MTQSILLAGGKSERMGENKLALTIDGKPLLCHTIDSVLPLSSKVIVVTGKYHDEIIHLLEKYPDVICVNNSRYEQGMFTSVKRGVEEVTEDFLILPADVPGVSSQTIASLIHHNRGIIVPSYHENRGHPIVFQYRFKDALLNEPDDSNLKRFRDRYDFDTLEVNDSGILRDIDTPNDYKRFTNRKD